MSYMSKYFYAVTFILILFSCKGKVEPAIQSGIDECENCTMIINNVDQGAVAIDSEEQTHTFCSPVCMISWINSMKQREKIAADQYYLFDHNDFGPLLADNSIIVHGDFNTAMGYGLLTFGDEVAAKSFASESRGEILNWNDLRLEHEIPDKNIILDCDTGAEPAAFEVNKNQLISFCIENPSVQGCRISLKGYDLEFKLNSDSSCARFVADKPGQGFVFVNYENKILASLHVTGEHTDEEKIYR